MRARDKESAVEPLVGLLVGGPGLGACVLAGWSLAHGNLFGFGGGAFVGLVLLRMARWL